MSFADTWGSAQDTADKPQGEYSPLPEGNYNCKLIEVDSELNPNDQVMRTTLVFEVQGGDHNARRIWEKVKHADNLMWKAVQVFNGMGLQGAVNSWHEWADMVKTKTGCAFDVETSNRTHDEKVYTGIKSLKIDDVVPF
tara:strand:- start:5542 stop:5958 length:417 start_codon:yes stop_codon:yes gene_type:complete